MLVETVSTISEYIAAVLRTRRDWYPADPYPEIWYRGVNNASLDLLPGAYWRKSCDEHSLVLSFRAMAPLLLPRMPTDEWDWYILMQHYRLPTRLLDWTENPLQALRFALTDLADGKTPCVWILDPVALNYSMHARETVFVPTHSDPDSDCANWLPGVCGRHVDMPKEEDEFPNNRKPIAIFPVRKNPRIFAQRGVFTVHGVAEDALNNLPIARKDGTDGIARIDVDPSMRLALLDDLWTLGHTAATTYPEPDSVSEDLKRMYRVG